MSDAVIQHQKEKIEELKAQNDALKNELEYSDDIVLKLAQENEKLKADKSRLADEVLKWELKYYFKDKFNEIFGEE